MSFILEIAKHTRLNFIKLIEGLSIEQLNIIPQGYSNNIAWNFAHMVAAQQTLCYVRGNVPTRIPVDKVTQYQKGTAPQGLIGKEEITYYKEKSLTLLNDLRTDVSAGLFKNYEPVTTAFGITLKNINDAISYFATHDNLHFGYAQALRKAVLHNEKAVLASEY